MAGEFSALCAQVWYELWPDDPLPPDLAFVDLLVRQRLAAEVVRRLSTKASGTDLAPLPR